MSSSKSIVIGKKDIDPDKPAHVPGVQEGNWPSKRVRRRRARGKEPATNGKPRRATGISAGDREPIDPRMPRLTPP